MDAEAPGVSISDILEGGGMQMNKIVCTLGPASGSLEVVKQMIDAGMSVARLNFSHGDHETHGKTLSVLREIQREEQYAYLAVAIDTKGPEIRTGCFPEGSVEIEEGAKVTLTTNALFKDKCTKDKIYIDHASLPRDLGGCRSIYIDDGALRLEALDVSVGEGEIHTRASNACTLSSRKGVNVPDCRLSLPALTEKDAADLKFAAAQKVDFIFASFVRKKEDVLEIRRVLAECGASTKIISKIENREGLRNLREIIEESDGIMVARGDMGIEVDFSKIFMLQRAMQSECLARGVPFVIATQMMESMSLKARPTRAEVTDVGYASLMCADGIMLSGETASGKHPVETVRAMSRISKASFPRPNLRLSPGNFKSARGAPSEIEDHLEALSATGETTIERGKAHIALSICMLKTGAPIVLVSDSLSLLRQFSLIFGCFPFLNCPPPQKISPGQITIFLF